MNKNELINFEKKIVNLYFDNKLPFLFHLSGGNEMQLIKIFKKIKKDDFVISSHRNHYHALLHGISKSELRNKILNGRSMFIYNKKRNFLCSAIIGSTPSIAVGIAFALKKLKSKKKVWCFVGDGTEDNGHTFEAARYIDGWDLPCKIVIECNDRSVEASNKDRWGKTSKLTWSFNSIIKYNYKINFPHARTPGMIDLSKSKKLTDLDYFPLIKKNKYLKYNYRGTKISYKDAITQSMEMLARHNVHFIGYNVAKGDAMGSLKNIKNSLKIETPVAENLMAGMALGMSLINGFTLLYIERHDFILNAMDCIVNHIDKIERISHGEFIPKVIIRAVTADGGPFYSGPTHSQDFTEALAKFVSMPIYDPKDGKEVIEAYKNILRSNRSAIVIERKSL